MEPFHSLFPVSQLGVGGRNQIRINQFNDASPGEVQDAYEGTTA